MIKTKEDILFNACKNVVGFDRSKRFKDWFHKKYDKEIYAMHHIFGSYSQSLKTSDYCSIPLSSTQHDKAEKDKSGYAVSCFPLLLTVMIAYIKYLESKIK